MPIVSAWVMPAGILGVARDAVRLRRLLLAADGRRHRLDDRGRALGREPSGRGRPHGRLRHRAAAARHRRPGRAVPAENAAALAGLALHRARHCPGDPGAAARRAGRAGGTAFAVRGRGRAAGHGQAGSDTFAVREWLAADADGALPRTRRWATASAAIRPAASRGSPTARSSPSPTRSRPSRRIAGAPRVVLSARDAPPDCGALVIDRQVWQPNRRGRAPSRRRGVRRSPSPGRPAMTGPGRARPQQRASRRQRRTGTARRSRATPRRTSTTWSPATERHDAR